METKPESEYDVFLSFRGSDTRLNFTDYLYRSMVHAGIHVFLDSEELEDGEEINGVLRAVNESRICIPIFSQNFASSSWCLREVACMVECTSESDWKKEIIPIFYDVEPKDVKLKTDLYKKAVRKYKKKVGKVELERWKSALVRVGGITGRELIGKRQGEEIDSIVELVSRKLNTRHMSVTEHLVEDSDQVEAITKLLDVGSDGVRFVGIHGMGGVGKTTLAKVMCNKLSFHFEGCCFLEDVRASSQPHDGLLNLQKKLLSGFVGSRRAEIINDVGSGIKMIKRVLSKKKVLIILDDLDKKEQLERLAGNSDWFHSGSRIIITTRDESILMAQVGSSSQEVLNQPEQIMVYKVHGMKLDLALHLFYKHAFRSDFAVEEYDALSRKIVHTVGMLPLAVVVIGSNLFDWGKGIGNSDKRKLWEETLKKLKRGPYKDVKDTLMISYIGLEENQKEIFLDIACFFTNEDKTYPVIMWDDCNYYPHTTMRVLSHRSFIKIKDDNRFWMHDQVRDFGRDIALNDYPRKFCRVWIHEQAQELLRGKEKNEDVEALSLNRNFTAEELTALPKLRFLQVEGSDFFGDFKNLLSELRWLSWQTWQTTFHANNFHFSNLVVLNLSNSKITNDWSGWSQMKMDRLKILDLTGCTGLSRTPDFSNFMSLEVLILAQCVKLTKIDGSIGKLKHLRSLNIKGCIFLQGLPIEFGFLQSLMEIIMPQNSHQPFKLPQTFGNLKSLSSFILDEHLGISQLPSSIGGLVKLTHLSLRGCGMINKLPCSIGEMEMLVELDLSSSGIVKLPVSIGCLKKLKVMKVSYTKISKFPRTIGQLEMLEELHAKKCLHLNDENLEQIGKLSHLRILDLSYTDLPRFPRVLDHLSCLQTLEMSSTLLQELLDLPSTLTHLHIQAPNIVIPDLSNLVSLDYLELSGLTLDFDRPRKKKKNTLGPASRTWDPPKEQLNHPLPSSLSTLIFRGINLLPSFSNLRNLSKLCVIEYSMPCFPVSQDLIHLKELKLSNCNLLEEISGLSLLKNLQHLDLNRLGSLVEIHGLSELESLLYLRISYCDQIKMLPSLSKLDKLWHIEVEVCPNIRAIEGLKGLESLELDDSCCNVLKRSLDVGRSTWFFCKRSMRCAVLVATAISQYRQLRGLRPGNE